MVAEARFPVSRASGELDRQALAHEIGSVLRIANYISQGTIDRVTAGQETRWPGGVPDVRKAVRKRYHVSREMFVYHPS